MGVSGSVGQGFVAWDGEGGHVDEEVGGQPDGFVGAICIVAGRAVGREFGIGEDSALEKSLRLDRVCRSAGGVGDQRV